MIKYQLDFDKSKEVYEYCKQHLEMKMCYNNIFECVTDYMSNFRSGKWKVAYGFTSVMANVYCRHCFIIDENNNVIDPTIFTKSEQSKDTDFYVMFVFDDVDEYLSAIENDNYMPALENYLKDKDKQAFLWAHENGIVLIG